MPSLSTDALSRYAVVTSPDVDPTTDGPDSGR